MTWMNDCSRYSKQMDGFKCGLYVMVPVPDVSCNKCVSRLINKIFRKETLGLVRRGYVSRIV